ncbi:hypothetical protein LCGC14_1317360 [marine sediment metagenome]|jgi:hypothetical protein|uniref:Uncharacterized protein n=1 Tax=marine sediment metagenome TaxID=412755 RepID=A0A0F9KKJ2_9ZZZZ|nr:hypothetical protein [Nitrosopumilus sp.]
MNKQITVFSSTIVALMLVSIFSNSSFAENQISQTELLPLNDSIGLEKTTLVMNVPENNHLPWGYVEGKISNPVLDYPVIIQIYDIDDYKEFDLANFEDKNLVNEIGTVHFAQTDVNDDGTYHYQFRVLGYDANGDKNYLEGDYIVKIFKVVYLQDLV